MTKATSDTIATTASTPCARMVFCKVQLFGQQVVHRRQQQHCHQAQTPCSGQQMLGPQARQQPLAQHAAEQAQARTHGHIARPVRAHGDARQARHPPPAQTASRGASAAQAADEK